MSEDDILLMHVLGCRQVDLLLRKPSLTPQQQDLLKSYKSRRSQGEPLQYIVGSWDFHGLEFNVNPSVLVPRPETEVLVELAIKKFQGTHIIDLGCGSGAIAVTLAKFLPYTKVIAVDISDAALGVAMGNAQRHGVEGRIDFVHEDMAVFLRDHVGQADMVVSNPPYIPSGQMAGLPADVRREPSIALDGGPDGLDFYRTIINHSPRLLRNNGCLMMEFGDGQAKAIAALAGDAHFQNIEIHKDLAGRERVIYARK